MRLVTFQDAAGARIGAMLGDDVILDLAASADLPSDMLGFIDAGPAALARAQKAVSAADRAKTVARSAVRLLAPIPRPRKNVFALGLNYADHVAEGARSRGEQVKLPEFPVYFTKAVTAVIGPEDPTAASRHNGTGRPSWRW
jgi:2-keto-4-pentenoate hydratase/2-oxohepta-3-ene-1,7-dioic acid hydratase in catechol pathway